MTKFARLNIIWQCGAFSTAVVLDAEHYKFISDTFTIREDEYPGLLFFKTFLKFSNKCVFRILCDAQRTNARSTCNRVQAPCYMYM